MKRVFLTEFMEMLISKLVSEQREGTAHVYRSTLNRVKEFLQGEDITFYQLTPEWLKSFEQKLLADELTWNTISTYMRMLRSVYNQAVESNVAPFVPRLFKKVYTGIDRRAKRVVEPKSIRELMKEKPEMPPKLAFSKDLFVLALLLRGMPFVDLAYLRRCDLKGNVITYRRHKTGRKLIVKVSKEAMEIVKRCMNKDADSHFLFPIIKSPGKDEYRQYTNMLRSVNYSLVKVSRILGLKEPISTYVARYTWATTALRRNYSMGLISDAMGHSSVTVTEGYFQSFREDEINKMNDDIVSYILCG